MSVVLNGWFKANSNFTSRSGATLQSFAELILPATSIGFPAIQSSYVHSSHSSLFGRFDFILERWMFRAVANRRAGSVLCQLRYTHNRADLRTMATAKPFVVVARRLEKSEEKKNKDIGLLKEVGKFEIKQDACSAYCAMVPLEGDKTPITIFENYDSKDYLLDDMKGHRSSKEYKRFKEIESKDEMLHKPTEIAFYATKLGFLHREDAPSVPLDDQFIWIAKLTAQPGKRDEMLGACRIHTENVKRTEKETFTFLLLESTDNDVDVLLFERYSNEKYFKDIHSTSESMKEYKNKIGGILADRDSAGFGVVAGFLDKRESV